LVALRRARRIKARQKSGRDLRRDE